MPCLLVKVICIDLHTFWSPVKDHNDFCTMRILERGRLRRVIEFGDVGNAGTDVDSQSSPKFLLVSWKYSSVLN